ncbi:MAG: hypothetical protein UT33_C0006G0078 [Candidatus Peregrinibacteria bacterium GW2011_GWC2_39_14]|nr:MAG: hypothetical protein UT33_C0006G0078 [Candidatus Peregrinibacteria bacterium GW2011_GWC2_39_14]
MDDLVVPESMAEQLLRLRAPELVGELLKFFKMTIRQSNAQAIEFEGMSISMEEAARAIAERSELGDRILLYFATTIESHAEEIIGHLLKITNQSMMMHCMCGKHSMTIAQLIQHMRNRDAEGIEWIFLWAKSKETIEQYKDRERNRLKRGISAITTPVRRILGRLMHGISHIRSLKKELPPPL